MDAFIKLFTTLADHYGLPWALLVAVCVAYWMEVQDRKKNSIPLTVFLKSDERTNALLEGQIQIAGTIAQLSDLVRLSLQRGGR